MQGLRVCILLFVFVVIRVTLFQDFGQYVSAKRTFDLVGWLCLTSNRQRGHLETAPPFTVPCEGREAR